MITVQTADNALKSFYLDAVKDAIDLKANPLLAQIEKTTSDVYGKDVRKVIRYGVNGGICAGTETGDLPTMGANNQDVFIASLKNLYGTIKISDKALRAAKGGEGEFVDILNDEMQSLIKSASFNLGRMLYGDGSGKLATISRSVNGKISVDSTKNLFEGMIVYFYSPYGGYVYELGARTILTVDRDNSTITVSSGDDNDFDKYLIADCWIAVQQSKDAEITGLEAIFKNSGTLYGVDRSSHTMLQAQVLNSEEISENIIQTMIDKIEERSGSKVNFIVCSWGVKRALAEYFREYKVAMPTLEFEGGYKAMSFNGIPIVADRFCPSGTMYLLNTDDFKLHQLCDWEWLEGEDGKVLKQEPGKPVYTATLVKYAELMCERPSGQGKIYGIAEK